MRKKLEEFTADAYTETVMSSETKIKQIKWSKDIKWTKDEEGNIISPFSDKAKELKKDSS